MVRGWLEGLREAEPRLMLWAPVLLALGIGGFFALPREPSVPEWALVCGLVALGLVLRGQGGLARVPGSALALVALGGALAGLRSELVAAPVLGFRYYGQVEGRVVGIDRSSSDALRITLDHVVLEDVRPERTPSFVRISLLGARGLYTPEPGQRVTLTAGLSPPEAPALPGGFDFTRYAWFQSLGAVGYTRELPQVHGPPDPGWALAGHRVRMRVSAEIQRQIPGQSGAVAAALMTGDRSGISEATNDSMRASSLYHIISISGLHMSLLAGIVFAAVRGGLALVPWLALRLPGKKVAAALALATCTFYLWLSGGGVATERAWLMTGVMLLAVIADRRAISLRTLALAAVAVLVMRPESLTEAGFQMSFAATIGLVLVFRRWAEWSAPIPRLLRPAALMVLTSLVAGLATAPIAAAHFNRIAQLGLVANLLAAPAVGLAIMPGAVVAALLAPVGLEGWALRLVDWGTRWMLWVSDTIAAFPSAVSSLAAPPWPVLPLLSLGALCVALLVSRGGRAAGALMLALGFGLWAMPERPALLVAADAAMIGLNGPEGLALARPRGAGFATESWLEDGGETLSPAEAARRPGLTRSKNSAEGVLNGLKVVAVWGKGAELRGREACASAAVVVVAGKRTAPPPSGPCLWLDELALRRNGSLMLTAEGTGLRLLTAIDVAGHRRWNARYWKWRAPEGTVPLPRLLSPVATAPLLALAQ